MNPRRAWVEQIMGLPISVHLRGPAVTSADVERQVSAVFAELRQADEVFSTYRADSQITRWERGDLALADADPALSEVLALCEQARQRTEGSFDARSLPDPIGPGLRFIRPAWSRAGRCSRPRTIWPPSTGTTGVSTRVVTSS
jgi:thiamine biosynthesis lipoprotein